MYDVDDEGRTYVTLTAADALRRAPPGERVRVRRAPEELSCAVLRRAAPLRSAPLRS